MEAAAVTRGHLPANRSLRIGAIAAGGIALFYVVVVWGLSGSFDHLTGQVASDWYLLLPIVVGFAVQVGLVSELRRRHRLYRGAAATGATAAGAMGTGASTVGMVACCAHHVADLAPLIGATAAATFLYDYRLPFMLVGIGVNALAIAIVVRRLRRFPTGARTPQEETCELG